MKEDKFNELLAKLLNDQCTDEEREKLLFLAEQTDDQELKTKLEDAWNQYDKPSHILDRDNSKAILSSILNNNSNVVRFVPAANNRFNWKKLSTAAAILLLVGLGGYLFFSYSSNNRDSKPEMADERSPDVKAPESNRAMITLANGQKIYLDSVANGTLVQHGGVNLKKLSNGNILYTADAVSQTIEFNTINNPRGSQVINLTLSDGTKVWLNSETSMRFPVNFVNNERKVEITGEAYFEVASSMSANGKRRPFKVLTNKMEIEVLGTHFNVNAYADEETSRTTLLEGKVKLNSGSSSIEIAPGQQAQISESVQGSFKIDAGVDVDKVMAWKNGIFEFDNVVLPVIMRQISRWYNVNIVYEQPPGTEKYGGGISMRAPLSDVLKLLEENGVSCELKGNKVVVRP